jgi:Ran GTPase-activating protein (RanGAP) involved in mRNA processing and transport
MSDAESEDLAELMKSDAFEQTRRASALHISSAASDAETEKLLHLKSLHVASSRTIDTLNTALSSEKIKLQHVNSDVIRDAFKVIDVDSSNTLTALEIIKSINKNDDVRKLLLLDGRKEEITAQEYESFFARIDIDGSKEVDISEFESFVNHIYEDEYQKKLQEAEELRLEEERVLKEKHEYGLALARDSVEAYKLVLDDLIQTYTSILGKTGVSEIINKIKYQGKCTTKVELALEAAYKNYANAVVKMNSFTGDKGGVRDEDYVNKLAVWRSFVDGLEEIRVLEESYCSLEDCTVDGVIDGYANKLNKAVNANDESEEKKELDTVFSLNDILNTAVDDDEVSNTISRRISDMKRYGSDVITQDIFTESFLGDASVYKLYYSFYNHLVTNAPNTNNAPMCISDIKKCLLTDTLLHSHLNIMSGDATFDNLYTTLSTQKPSLVIESIHQFLTLFHPHFIAYNDYVNVRKCVDSVDGCWDRDRVRLYHDKHFDAKNVFVAVYDNSRDNGDNDDNVTDVDKYNNVLERLPMTDIGWNHVVFVCVKGVNERLLLKPDEFIVAFDICGEGGDDVSVSVHDVDKNNSKNSNSVTEQKAPEKEIQIKTEIVKEIKKVPVINIELAEKYVKLHTAYNLLTLTHQKAQNHDGWISISDFEQQCLSNEEIRLLLGIDIYDFDDFIRQLKIFCKGDVITWTGLRTYFMRFDDDINTEESNVLSADMITANELELQRLREGHIQTDDYMRNMITSMEALLDTAADDQEAVPALNDGEDYVVNDLNWISDVEEWKKLKGPPKVPERGAELHLGSVYIDGPKWYVVISPREVHGAEGPLGIKHLIDYWDDEVIDSHSLVWKEGLEDWLPIEDVADLKAQLLLPELHSTFRPHTAPGVFSSVDKKKKKAIVDPKPIKLQTLNMSQTCTYCGCLATAHIEVPDSVRQLNQGLKDPIALNSGERVDDKSEILNDFLFLGNAASSRERPTEIMEYTHIINCSVNLPCYWDYDDEVNAWLKTNLKIDDMDGTVTGDDKAVAKYGRLKHLNIKYFRVGLDDDPFGRPDTAASKFSVQSWRESEFSSRPLTALTDPLLGGAPGTASGSRPGTRERTGSASGGRPRTGSVSRSRPMTGGLRPMTPAEIEIIPEFATTHLEEQYASGYNAAVVSIQSAYRGHSSRESSRPGTANDADRDAPPPPLPGRTPLTTQQLKELEESKLKLGGIRRMVAEEIVNSFEAVFEWLSRENVSRKVRCLVHSKTGFCSAAAVVAAYIIRTQGLTYEETIAHLRTKHSPDRVLVMDSVWEDALRIYSQKYSIGHLICDDCFLEQFVEGKADERVFNEVVEKVVKRLELNDKSLTELDLRDEEIGTGGDVAAADADGESEQEEKGESAMKILCHALRDSMWLRHLDLSGNMICDEDCKLLGSALLTNDGLTALNVSYNRIGDEGCKEIAAALKLHKLSVLNLSYNGINAMGGTALGNMLTKNSHLHDLNLRNNNIGDGGGYAIFDALTTPLYESEEVMLAKAKIYESGGNVEDLGESYNVSLCALDVSCNNLGQESAKRLVGVLQVNTVLTVLNLDYNPNLGNTEAREIANAMRTYCPSLEWLSFSDNGVGNDVAGAFARSLGDSNSLVKKFCFAQNALRSTGVSRVATALKSNSMLVYLDLGRNPMGSKGCAHLAEALGANRSLRELVLDCCGIDEEGCAALGEMLEENFVLQKLDLSDNSVLNGGAVSLFGGLEKNRGLTELNLTNTGIGVKASEVIAETLRVNEFLSDLNLSNNQVRNYGCEKLAEMLAENVVLRRLNLSFNLISSIGINKIVDSINKRETMKFEVGMMKALELDIVLVGNLFSKDVEVGGESQLVVLPKMARSKMIFDNATSDSRDVPMWQKSRDDANKNFVRRKSFSAVAGDEFDEVVDVGKQFPLTGTMIKSSSEDVLGGGGPSGHAKQLGLITKIAEPVDVPRWRGRMEEHGNDVRYLEKKTDAWAKGFSSDVQFN